ncbi:MAG: TonB-dependent receptor [Cytophagaceae bacterium]|nr:TonB-dependent receptor [Cytophagaceae bacterium]
MKFFLLGSVLLLSLPVLAQNSLRLKLTDDKTKLPLPGATIQVPALSKGIITDAQGEARFNDLPTGEVRLRLSSVGYHDKTQTLRLPLADTTQVVLIDLEPTSLDLEGVTVTSTRTNSRIEEIPVRVEVVGLEEIEEKVGMRPANISMLLSETSGVQVQQTSALSANQSVRLLGLDGKYTQLLKDGFPLYSGLANGLSLMQIPPLDLQQVELIKGSSSALYGGDAIGGIINLISKQPTREGQTQVLLNATHKGGADVAVWYAKRNARVGTTMLAQYNFQKPYDVNDDGFTDLPKTRTLTINPKLFWYANEETTLTLGVNHTRDDRTGGFLRAIQDGGAAGFTEENESRRTFTTVKLERKFDESGGVLTLKNALNFFNRSIAQPGYRFSGRQFATYSEASYFLPWQKHKSVLGANLWTDRFAESTGQRDYRYATLGGFLQDDWALTEALRLQAGLRADYQHRDYAAEGSTGNLYVLPRLSVMDKLSEHWTLRIGAGLGYKAPTLFDTQSEQSAYQNLLPLTNRLKAETSKGITADANYKTTLGEVFFTVNQSFFYTVIDNPLVLTSDCTGAGFRRYFRNVSEPVRSQGFETNAKWGWEAWKLFVAYTYTDARNTFQPKPVERVEFAPQHKVVTTLVYEVEKKFRAGLEGFYTGPQHIGGGERSRGYFIAGLMAEKLFRRFSVIGNLEDFSDTRQTRFENILLSALPQRPQFRPIYAPLDGFIANVALRINL